VFRGQEAKCDFNLETHELTVTLNPDTETMKRKAAERDDAANPDRAEEKERKKRKAGNGSGQPSSSRDEEH
jgi:hypothetical protein